MTECKTGNKTLLASSHVLSAAKLAILPSDDRNAIPEVWRTGKNNKRKGKKLPSKSAFIIAMTCPFSDSGLDSKYVDHVLDFIYDCIASTCSVNTSHKIQINVI